MGTVAAMSRSILIYANCQGEELQKTGRYMPCLAERFDFKWIPLHLVEDSHWTTQYGPDFMADVVMLWEQVETGEASRHRTALHERLPTGCPVVKFPPLSAMCLWPFAGNDPRRAVDPDRYPWPDSVAAALATQNLPDDELFETYLRITTEKMPDLDRWLYMDVARWKASDALSDVPMAEWVERTFRSTNLFYTRGHITAHAIAHLMKQVLGQSAALGGSLMRGAVSETDTLWQRHAGQDCECVPIHPLVAERLGLRFYDPDATYRWHGHDWTFRQYILHYVRWSDYLR
jgi:hypothetical protein